MSYSNNVKNLILTLVKQGHSPEETLKLLSRLIHGNQENSNSYFKKLAESLSVPFTPVDCYEIFSSLPSPKTIRYWVAKEPKSKNQNQFPRYLHHKVGKFPLTFYEHLLHIRIMTGIVYSCMVYCSRLFSIHLSHHYI